MITLSCSQCSGTIARDIELEASSATLLVFKMSMKCPHCKSLQKVEIRTMIEKQIRINGRLLEAGTGESKDEHSPIRTLSG